MSHYLPRHSKISAVVIHYTAAPVHDGAEVVRYWDKNDKYSSAHYIIDIYGRITAVIGEEFRAYTSGSFGLGERDIDDRAITIECSTQEADSPVVPGATIDACCKLLADIGYRYGIWWRFTGNEQGNIHAHRWYQNTPCPGDYLYSKFPLIQDMANYILYKKEENELEDRLEKIEQELEDHETLLRKHTYPCFNKIEDFPVWARDGIQWLIDEGYLNGNDIGLQLSMDMLRTLCILSRTVRDNT